MRHDIWWTILKPMEYFSRYNVTPSFWLNEIVVKYMTASVTIIKDVYPLKPIFVMMLNNLALTTFTACCHNDSLWSGRGQPLIGPGPRSGSTPIGGRYRSRSSLDLVMPTMPTMPTRLAPWQHLILSTPISFPCLNIFLIYNAIFVSFTNVMGVVFHMPPCLTVHSGVSPQCKLSVSWWRHDMNTFLALLAICKGNPLMHCRSTHMYASSGSNHHCFRCSALSTAWTPRKKLQWNLNQIFSFKTLDPYILIWLTIEPGNHRPANFWNTKCLTTQCGTSARWYLHCRAAFFFFFFFAPCGKNFFLIFFLKYWNEIAKSGESSGWNDEDRFQNWSSHSSSTNNRLHYLSQQWKG